MSCVLLCTPWPREELLWVLSLHGRDSHIHGLLNSSKKTVKMQIPGPPPTQPEPDLIDLEESLGGLCL